MPKLLTWSVSIDRFPTAGTFTIARGSRREAVVVLATVSDGQHVGRGEATPYARYGETVDGVAEAIIAAQAPLDRDLVRRMLPAGAARNAIDCALIDLEAKRAGRRAYELLGLPAARPLTTAYTLSLAPADEMAAKARAHADKPLLKVKLGGPDDITRLAAVRAVRPDARLIIDANEGWAPDVFPTMMQATADLGVELIEQPMPAGQDERLADMPRLVPLCADESVHTRDGLDRLASLYDAVNIKLDKTGGLTEALLLRDAARAKGLKIMVGCMVATSLAIAPAILLAQGADWVDLDGPLLLAEDRPPALHYDGARVSPPERELWG